MIRNALLLYSDAFLYAIRDVLLFYSLMSMRLPLTVSSHCTARQQGREGGRDGKWVCGDIEEDEKKPQSRKGGNDEWEQLGAGFWW